MKSLMAVALACAALSSAAYAQSAAQPPSPPYESDGVDIGKLLINSPEADWAVFGSDQTSQQVPNAVRVNITKAGINPWDTGAVLPLVRGFSAGDVILLAVAMRAPSLNDGEILPVAYLGLNGNAAPYDIILRRPVTLTNQWKTFYVSGRASKSLRADQAVVGLHLGQAQGVIDLGKVDVYNLGPDADINQLPKN